MEEQLEQEKSELYKMKEAQLQHICVLDKAHMSWWRTTAPNKLPFQLSIRNEDSTTVQELIPSHRALQSRKATCFGVSTASWYSLCCRTSMNNVRLSLRKCKKMNKRAIILSLAIVDPWMVTVAQLITCNELVACLVNLYTDQYSKNMLQVIISCLVL